MTGAFGLSDEAIDDIAQRVLNWGRWGADDQIGTLNLISDEARRAACASVTTGRHVSLARPLNLGLDHPGVRAPVHATWKTHRTPAETAADFIGLAFHGAVVTHLDALNHVHRDDTMYNGHDALDFEPLGGYPVLSVDRIADALCGRGVLLDLPAAGLAPELVGDRPEYGAEALQQCCARLGITPAEGDIVLVRCGHSPDRFDRPTPGLSPDAALWLHAIGAAALGSDGASDAFPAREGRWKVPIHQLAIWAMGMPLLDNCALDDVSRLAAEHERYSFLLVAGALPIKGATGSPLNPLAIF